MLEMIMAMPKALIPKAGQPLMGFNFDQGKSISAPSATAYSGGAIETLSASNALAGYGRSLRCNGTVTNVTPLSALSTLGLGDFTLECYAWMTTIPSAYFQLFLLQFANGKYLTIRVGDGGYGQRMQVGIDLGNGGNYCSSKTGPSLRNGWHHYAFVRKAGKCRFFIDGQLQLLALGTSTTFNLTEFNGNFDLSGNLSSFAIGKANSGVGDMYMPEFLLSNTARYQETFTPPPGPIYRP
ncbi:hypothetical protein Ea357_113 [Erwinia phage Ea35-70]|uniref:LamG domain-containing protein n=1 Tax=Erwinia phage Ea35-70 TaxID=1429768 RepID=W6B1H1_9CAUD|nr:hypothetical protein Ea357_113 [Erwinia phage Ea35-70]AHI60264.1 hypothetical protein Ea357_113 [Erwinia phage Ea35-70]